MKRKLFVILALLFILTFSTTAFAGYIYVGNWELADGPNWQEMPLAYSGLQAAALLFGGSPDDYAISTVGIDPLTIDHNAWYGILGYGGGLNNGAFLFAEDYLSTNSSQAPGYYYSGNEYRMNDITESASAYIGDNARYGNVNYAFRITGVPEPTTMLLLGLGLVGIAGFRKRAN